MDVSGFGEWVFARPVKLGATLVLAKPLEGTYWVADGKQEMIAEVSKPAGAAMSVSLQPGWYRIVRPHKRTASVAEVNLAWGGARELSVDDFAEVRLEPTRLRGTEPIVVRPWRVSLGYGLGSPLLNGETLEHGVEASVVRRSSWWFVRGSLSANFSALSGSTFRASQRQFGGGLGFGVSTGLWLFDVSVAAELRVAYLSQIVVRGDADDVGRIFGVVEPERGGWIFGGGLRLAAAVPVGDRWAIGLNILGALMRVPMETGVKVVPSGQLGASIVFSL